jgi:DNA polymerase-1
MTKTVVTHGNLNAVLATLNAHDHLAFDTETTGLVSFQGAEMFSLAICTLEGDAFYFNFREYTGLPDDHVLKPTDVQSLMCKPRTWIAQNAKFDLHMVAKTCCEMRGTFEDTKTLARLFENNRQYSGGYSLEALAERYLSVAKDDRVKKWMDENNGYTAAVGWDGRSYKNYHFNMVPFPIISEYAMQDAYVTVELFKFFKTKMYPNRVEEIERDLIPILYRIEKRGVQLNQAYVEEAYSHESLRLDKAKAALEAAYPGFTDSAEFIAPILLKDGIVLPKTEKDNDQVNDKALKPHATHPLVGLLLEFRDAQKRAQTYWFNYMSLTDPEFVIHPNLNSDGTATGRFSCNNPNLQNIPSDDEDDPADEGPFPVRRAFIARPGFKLVAIDYSQMEFRLMLEYARQMDLIEKIKEGLDPHDATAELTGLSRKAAKTLNFGLLYGMGVAKLGDAIGVDADTARQFKYKYFAELPGVKGFINQASRAQEEKGYTMDVYGRRFYLEGWVKGRRDTYKWSYKSANSIIQGGCADICKRAMVEIEHYLTGKKSRMVLQIHDEIVFEVHDTEVAVIADLKRIMETVYEAKHMPMKCSVEVGDNLHDMVKANV